MTPPDPMPPPVSPEIGFAAAVLERMDVPAFVLDAKGRVLIWNRACERLTGVPASEVVGSREHWRGFYERPRLCLADVLAQGRIAELALLYVNHVAPDGRSLSAENWCVMPRRGERRYLAIRAEPILDARGRLMAVVETLEDRTEHRQVLDVQAELQRLAHIDALTGLANRRAFDDVLAHQWRLGLRRREPVALLMADIDRFKDFNDRFGHPEGDECLRRLGRAMGSLALRAGDLAARYGGEEFALILADTDLDGALGVAERVRELMAAERFACAGDGFCVTLSVGVASLVPTPDGDAAKLVRLADDALYRAKRGGRNTVEAMAA